MGDGSKRAPTFTRWDDSALIPLTEGNVDAASAYLLRYEALVNENIDPVPLGRARGSVRNRLMEFVVALRMLDAFDCLQFAEAGECNASSRCLWQAKGNVCYSKHSIANPETVQEMRRLDRPPSTLTMADRLQRSVLRSINQIQPQLLQSLSEIEAQFRTIRDTFRSDLHLIEKYFERYHLLLGIAKIDDERKIQHHIRQMNSTIAALESSLDILRAGLRSIDAPTRELLEEWVEELPGKAEARRKLNPFHRMQMVVEKGQNLVDEYKRHREKHPIPTGWAARARTWWRG